MSSFAAVALLVGFAMMTLQTVLIRLGGLSFGSSQFTFSMVVAVFVLCIALGSFAVSALPRIPRVLAARRALEPAPAFGRSLQRGRHRAVLGARAAHALYRNHPETFYPYQANAFLGVLLVLALPVALSGAVLPLMFHALRDRVGDLGDMAGRLYSWNTLGSLLGALIGGYALLFWLDLHHSFRIAMAAIAIAAVLMTMQRFQIGRLAPALALASALAVIAMLPAWRPERLAAGTFRIRAALVDSFSGPTAFFRSYTQAYTLRFYDDDPVASISVKAVQGSGGATLAIVSNGKSDGSIPRGPCPRDAPRRRAPEHDRLDASPWRQRRSDRRPRGGRRRLPRRVRAVDRHLSRIGHVEIEIGARAELERDTQRSRGGRSSRRSAERVRAAAQPVASPIAPRCSTTWRCIRKRRLDSVDMIRLTAAAPAEFRT